jgi:hypothetical protein
MLKDPSVPVVAVDSGWLRMVTAAPETGKPVGFA